MAGRFSETDLQGLPPAAVRYLRAAIAPGAPLAGAVRLTMHGEIRLRGWCRFRAEQVIRADGAMIWAARVRMGGLPVAGSDRLIDGRGALDWRILGLIPVMRRSDPDITRSSIGRALGERIWLPSALLPPGAQWHDGDGERATATLGAWGETVNLTVDVDEAGAPTALSFPRWGDPDGRGFRYERFGGRIEALARFGQYRIPAKLSVGWRHGGDGMEAEGEFFRCVIDTADFR